MAEMVKAWNKRTGEELPNRVPKAWLDKGLFPNLAASASAASRAQSQEEQQEVQEEEDTKQSAPARRSGTKQNKEA